MLNDLELRKAKHVVIIYEYFAELESFPVAIKLKILALRFACEK